ncbi:inactive hydroxysteroid dehydrogenase-like protein 1 [Mizuhopecten yessoensis]|uniref:Inactive hydroxysteroid dehydrogenase-like protein 1 n=1 Tax=Mizuhopecten yessoensis TaxID=6573 RepID=A0A210QEN5_MIZYE|nr:inactive hydroxysteroid dehydrogenase-like protein 1 [Mizuhopecten yessoensis]OWF47111.1 Inactive hydroxysteroid dehydrogenase-like protein 1 [Mizuhopecten yessoensis]
MAAVDSFEYLFHEISMVCRSTRDSLALIGGLYASRKTLQFIYCVLKAGNDHLLSKLSRWSNLKRRFGQWAVVTGSSEGIGRAYARELAGRGLNIILISKKENRLYRTAKDIEEKYGVQTCALGINFNEGQEIYQEIWEAIKDKEIGILVNNVGVMYDYPQPFLEVPTEMLWQLINVNVATATMMTHMILPQMVQRCKGAVVMVSAGSCDKITPLTTVYSATKSFLDYFARAIQYEYKDKGIIVQSLMPFYVATRMTRFSETLSRPSIMIPSAADYARHAITTLGYTSRTTGYWPHTLQGWIIQCIPDSLWMWGASRLNYAFKRQTDERIKRRSLRLMHSDQSQESDS